LEQILKSYLDRYYDLLIEQKHIAIRLNTVLLKNVESYSTSDSVLRFSSALILRDWSGVTDNGWAYAYPTDSLVSTDKEDYSSFINDLLSKQFSIMYAQSFEGLETLLRDFLFELADKDEELKIIVEGKLKKNQAFSRKNIPTGDSLIEIINGMLDLFLYQKKEVQFDLITSFYILSKTRHYIVHNNYILSKSTIFCSTDKGNLFNELFKYKPIDKDNIKVQLDIDGFKNLMDFMCGFAFQILKKCCLKYDLNWKLYKNMR
jgi:hypothetical protein